MSHPRARVALLAGALALAHLACGGGAASEPDGSPSGDPDAATGGPDAAVEAGELRGLWVTRFAYNTPETLEGIIDRAAAANFNAVFVQIRGNGDAYYDSALEPWAQKLTGTLGRDPGWDPLQVAIDRAHMHGMELHAYFNVLAAWPTSQAPVPEAEGPVQHPLLDNPEWLAVDSSGTNQSSEYLWFSPGNPEVRAHTGAVVEDLLTNYAVDGLHLDRIRTAGPDYSRDDVSEAAFTAAKEQDPSLTWGDFMREQVNLVVEEIHDAIERTRPSVRHSAAVWGIYEVLPGCTTSEGYDGYYQDSLEWLDRETMDALVPMIYWGIEAGSCTDWATLLDFFLERAGERHVWGGMHALDTVEGDRTWVPAEVEARIDYARAAEAQGTVVFASTYLDSEMARWDMFVGNAGAPGPFAEPMSPPEMPWKP